ncbi:hypothetical protein KXW54_001219, partial [Aspergillus fumigatus]
NTASQLQIEFEPASALEDRVYVMALLSDGNHAVTVYAGGDQGYVKWDSWPEDDGTGIFFGSAPFHPGKVSIRLDRGDGEAGYAVGLDISDQCEKGYNNYNAWVGSFTASAIPSTQGTTGSALKDQACIRGKGAYDFNDLCNFTFSYGYCPVGACT